VVGVGISTALFGALPTVHQIGLAAPIVFLLLRLVQGVFVGGVVASTHTIGTESVAPKYRGAVSGLIGGGGAGMGALLASLTYLLMSSLFPGHQFEVWGWRCMFFAGIVILVAALDAGADDYLGKPFDLAELVSRCRALIRRSQGRSAELIAWRGLTVDPVAQTVSKDGARVPLTAREWSVLIHLLTHAGVPQPRARIEESLYGWHEEVESNAIEVHVSNLRKKLGGDVIRTVRGFGYVVDKT